MASEAVKILIEAEDIASAKVAQAAAKIDQNVKKIKDVGGKAKASTEFIGQLAGQLGGSEISAFAGQLGGLTEKISQFSEVSKLGGAGALAFKAGLVGVVGVLSFNVGKAIGDWWFETDRWNKELEDAIANSERLTQRMIDLRNVQLQDDLTAISFLDRPKDQIASIEELIKSEENLAKQKKKRIEEELAGLKKLQAEFSFTNALRDVGFNPGETSAEKAINANIANYEKEQAAIQANIDSLKRKIKQEEELRPLANEKAARDFIASLEHENMLLAAQGDEVFQLRAKYAGLTGDMEKNAVFLMKMADAEKQRQEASKKAEDERKRALEQEQAERKRIIDLVANENVAQQERLIAITKGAEAAKAFRLEMQGVAKDEAMRIAARDAELDRMEKEKRDKEQNRGVSPTLQATEMRLIRFGEGDTQGKIAQATQASQKHLEYLARVAAEREAREARAPRQVKVRDIRFSEVR